MMAVAVLAIGCGKRSADPPAPEPATQGPVQSFVGGPSAPAQSSVRRGMEIQKAKQHLYNFKQFYATFKTERNKGPANLKEFTDYIQRDDPTLVKLLNEQAFTVNFKSGMPGDAIVAYVSWEDGAGNRAVLTESGEVKVLGKQEFDAALKK